MCRLFKLSKSALGVVLPPARPYSLNLLNQHPSWEPSMLGLMGSFSIKPPQGEQTDKLVNN